jgi:hypothetical protein
MGWTMVINPHKFASLDVEDAIDEAMHGTASAINGFENALSLISDLLQTSRGHLSEEEQENLVFARGRAQSALQLLLETYYAFEARELTSVRRTT